MSTYLTTTECSKIDKVETVTITYGQKQTTFDFNDEIIDLVSYGGFILEVDNMIEVLFFSYGDELIEKNLSPFNKKTPCSIAGR